MDLYTVEDSISKIKDFEFIRIKESKIDNPVFSVVIPAYNRLDGLLQALDVILDQTFDMQYEVVVVDDNPERNNPTEITMKDYPSDKVAYYKNACNAGLVGNWNRCLLAARAEWVVYCHDDDLLIKEALENIYKTIKNNPSCKAVVPRIIQKDNPFSENSSEVLMQSKDKGLKFAIKKRIKRGFPLAANMFCDNIFGPPTCGMTVHKETMINFGGWIDGYLASDWITMLKYSLKHKVVRCCSQTGVYVWGTNLSLQGDSMLKMSKERNEIISTLPQVSKLCSFYSWLLHKDFERKNNELLSDFGGKRSRLYKIIYRYYLVRID